MSPVNVTGPYLGQSAVCAPILHALPEWFGIPEATAEYITEIETLPTLLAHLDHQVVGFLSIKQHNSYSAELYVMGVHPSAHRKGVGRALVKTAEDKLHQQGVEFFQVKTLSSTHPDKNYAKTRAFYEAMGFRPLEEFPTLWGEHNPCLLMIKTVQEAKLDPK
jgi:ribosomal protein S18 acetylase RimI-like enzyme